MADLVQRLNDDLKAALKGRDAARTGVLRMLLSKVKDAQIAQGRGEPLQEAQVVQILTSYAKQRQESAEAFEQAGRADLRDRELAERDIVRAYLPEPLDEAALRRVLQETIAAVGATSVRDLGKVMGPALAKLQGRADGGRVQKLVRELLGG